MISKQFSIPFTINVTISAVVLGIGAGFAIQNTAMADTYTGGVSEKGYKDTLNSGATSYPAPQMMKAAPQPAIQAAPRQPMKAAAAKQNAPVQLGASKSIALPAGFLGRWTVRATRKSVEAQPEFQAGAENAFAINTTNSWNITGDPQKGYVIESDSGINTQLYVDKVGKGTAIIRYQHPVKNTNAQESVILTGGGNSFEGLERIAIVKAGQPPRAKVEYNLSGSR